MRNHRLARAAVAAALFLMLSLTIAAPAGAAPAYRSHAQGTGAVFWGNGDFTLSRPTGTQNTDLLIATVRIVSSFNVVGLNWPSSHGWTLLQDNGDAGKTYWRWAGSATSYTLFSWDSATFPLPGYAGSITAFSGVDQSTPLANTGAAATGSGTSASLPNTTATRDGSLRFSTVTVGSATATGFTGITESGDVSGNSLGIASGWAAQNTGTTASASANWGSSQNWVGHTFVIQGTGPTVSSLSPSSGSTAGGTSVVITGTNLTGASAVTFGGTPATGFTVNSATQITATSPARAAGAADVLVTTAGGTSSNTAADDYTYADPPTVTSIAPGSGPTAAGTSVVITGTNLTGASAVSFGGTPASGFTVDSATQITATAPAGSAGTVDVRVTTLGGQSANTAADDYTYVAAPAIGSISPSSGPEAGGTSVTITGTNLTGATQVRFGATDAASYTVDSATQITAIAPAATGVRNIRVTTAGGISPNTAADDFTFVAAPTVTGLAPSSGPTSAGTSVVITGTNLTGASAVSFGGTPASGFTVDSATQITATAPAGSAGTVDVRVTTTGGQSANTAADNYAYVAAPTVTGLSPSSGPTAAGTSVVITGTNLTGASAVSFGATPASGFTVNSATQITATAPAGSAGTVDVRVTTTGGQSANTAADNYTYVAAPTVVLLAPAVGSTSGGTSVVITGTNLTGASAVSFGGTPATGFTVDSATQITATAPAASAGTVDVRVTTAGGQSANTLADNFTYLPCSGGSLSVTPPDVTFDPLALNGLDQTRTKQATMPVIDLSGAGTGWKLQVGGTQFSAGGGRTLPADAARVVGASYALGGGACAAPTSSITYPLTVPEAPTKATVYNAAAGTGLGPVDLTLDLELDIPANTQAGTYTSTWTIDIAQGP